jgi:glycosyltransferase involved in cell wall biosynthesis
MPPHICFISPSIYRQLRQTEGKSGGGAERQQHMIAAELQNRGYTISMIVGDFGQPAYEQIETMDIWNGCPRELDGFTSIPSRVFKLFRRMRNINADIYYTRGSPRLFSAVSFLCRLLNKRLIFCIANESDIGPQYLNERYNLIYRRLYRIGLNQVDTVITQTQKQREMLKTHFKIESTVIPNGYDLPSKQRILDHSSREFVLWVGRSHKNKKRPMRYLELAERLPEIPFVMITHPANDGSHHKKIKKRAQSIDNLDFVGTVAPSQVHGYHREATMLINTSNWEGFPNTFLEAWRYETPVVSLHFTLNNRLKRQNIGICSGSMEKITSDVFELHNDIDTRAKMGRKGRKYLREHYFLDDIVDRYETLLRDRSCSPASESTPR